MFLKSYLRKVWKQNIRDVAREVLGEKKHNNGNDLSNTSRKMMEKHPIGVKDEYINSGDHVLQVSIASHLI